MSLYTKQVCLREDTSRDTFSIYSKDFETSLPERKDEEAFQASVLQDS